MALQKVGVKSVLAVERKAEIEVLARASSGVAPGQPGYIGHYQRAREQIFRELSSDELDEMEALSSKWQKQGNPPEVQRK